MYKSVEMLWVTYESLHMLQMRYGSVCNYVSLTHGSVQVSRWHMEVYICLDDMWKMTLEVYICLDDHMEVYMFRWTYGYIYIYICLDDIWKYTCLDDIWKYWYV